MDNFSGVRLHDRIVNLLSEIEQEVEVPIRIIDCGGRAVTPNMEANNTVSREWGYSTITIDEAVGGFFWREDHHPEGLDTGEGLTILVRGLHTPFMRGVSFNDLIGQGALRAGEVGRNMADRAIANRENLLVPSDDQPMDLAWVGDLETIPWPDWHGTADPHAMAYAFTLEGVDGRDERCLVYPFQPNRQVTGDVARGRVDRNILWRGPIEVALGATEELRARAMERARERFNEFATGRLGSRIRSVRGTVSGLENDVQLHQQALLDSTVRLREEKITLDTLLSMDAGESVGIDPEAEWAALERHQMVDSFTIRGGRFVIETVELTLTDPDTHETAPLGRMRISFPLEPGSGRGIDIRNLTNARDDGSGIPRHHPHVPGSGAPCFGNVMSEVARMGAVGEVGGLLELLLQYLQTFNPRDDYGRFAGLWYEGEVRPERRR
jgi:hypothetical protein